MKIEKTRGNKRPRRNVAVDTKGKRQLLPNNPPSKCSIRGVDEDDEKRKIFLLRFGKERTGRRFDLIITMGAPPLAGRGRGVGCLDSVRTQIVRATATSTLPAQCPVLPVETRRHTSTN